MKCYLVTDGDLSHLSLANWLVTGLFAAGSFCLAQGIQIYLSAAFSTGISAEGRVLTSYAQPLFFILSVVLYAAGIGAHRWRRSHIEIIKRESNESL